MAGRIVAIAIALSFIATLVPIASVSAKSNTMPCCVGKEAGHCDSGIPAKKVSLPEPEPMCGLTAPESENDGITIVAETSHNESHYSQSQTVETSSLEKSAESASLSQPCHTDCCACVSGLARNLRERGTAHANLRHSLLSKNLSRFEVSPRFFSSNTNWEQTSPRGPPVSLL